MTLITKEQIDSLYKKVNLNPKQNYSVSNFLNTGMLDNRLNSSSLNNNLTSGNLNKILVKN